MGESLEERQTGRTEAFSDGVFAFAITLLVINLKDPGLSPGVDLFRGLLNEWPAFFALVTTFFTVLVMWVGHHNMFTFIRQLDTKLMFANGLLLLVVVLTPFATILVADNLLTSQAREAATVYAGLFLALSVIWNGLWYSLSRRKLIRKNIDERFIRSLGRQYSVGPLFYVFALVVSYFNALASVVIILLAAVFFAITASIPKSSRTP
ncbi:MAG: TMEM175 family protein [Thaumarchaeota archaeon]|nr:TMEM175 family protein [Nitrososphaerota archaeon]